MMGWPKVKNIIQLALWYINELVQQFNSLPPEGVAAISKVYRQVSNIRRTLVGNWIVDHSDIVGASPVGAAPTISSFST